MQSAIYGGSYECFNLLLDRGAHLLSRTPGQKGPLHLWALGAGNPAIADLLLANHIDPNGKDENGSTPLHLAARQGSFQAVQWLIAHGADVNAKDAKGGRPLGRLQGRRRGIERRKDVADLLRAHGAKT